MVQSAEGNFIAVPMNYGPLLTTTTTPSAAADLTVKTVSGGTTYTAGTDYIIDDVTGTVCALSGGAITNGEVVVFNYYYNALSSETLTVGGLASVTQSALVFYHPYKDGRVFGFTIFQASPMGAVTLPFEELAYSHSEFEMQGIADFTRSAGAQLCSVYREIPS